MTTAGLLPRGLTPRVSGPMQHHARGWEGQPSARGLREEMYEALAPACGSVLQLLSFAEDQAEPHSLSLLAPSGKRDYIYTVPWGFWKGKHGIRFCGLLSHVCSGEKEWEPETWDCRLQPRSPGTRVGLLPLNFCSPGWSGLWLEARAIEQALLPVYWASVVLRLSPASPKPPPSPCDG